MDSSKLDLLKKVCLATAYAATAFALMTHMDDFPSPAHGEDAANPDPTAESSTDKEVVNETSETEKPATTSGPNEASPQPSPPVKERQQSYSDFVKETIHKSNALKKKSGDERFQKLSETLRIMQTMNPLNKPNSKPSDTPSDKPNKKPNRKPYKKPNNTPEKNQTKKPNKGGF